VKMEFWKKTRFQKDTHLQNSSHVDEIMKFRESGWVGWELLFD
jgi:hypothetical protein